MFLLLGHRCFLCIVLPLSPEIWTRTPSFWLVLNIKSDKLLKWLSALWISSFLFILGFLESNVYIASLRVNQQFDEYLHPGFYVAFLIFPTLWFMKFCHTRSTSVSLPSLIGWYVMIILNLAWEDSTFHLHSIYSLLHLENFLENKAVECVTHENLPFVHCYIIN